MKKPHQEELLQELYAQSKKKVQQPNQVTQQILNYAKAQRSPFSFLLQWQTVCAALLIGFLWLQNNDVSTPVYSITADYNEADERVYYHQVNYQPYDDVNNHDSIPLAEDPEYFAYLASLSKLQDANQLSGVVKNTEGDLVVQVCQLGLVKLSEDLLKQIDTPRVTKRFAIGQNILLLTDNRGKFVDIKQQTTGYQCAD